MNTTRHYFLHLLALLAIAFSFASCTPEDLLDILDDDEPETPVTPTNSDDKNTVTVTTSGALVSHGDISINFPSGTFTSDAKVTVVEEKKGEVSSKYEASTFYKVTMPATTNKKLTVKVKSNNLGDDVNFVMLSTGYAPSALRETSIECYPQTTYAGGEYTTTIPASDNGDDPEKVSFTIGLAHIPTLDGAGVKETRSLVDLNWALESGEVDGVKWDIYIGWEAWALYSSGTLNQMKAFAPTLNACIKEAVHEIRNLGFKLNGQHSIPFYFSKTENWGEHVQHWAHNNWWSCLYISIPKILESNCQMTKELKMTVIHETLHYFQSDYDPRYFTGLKRGDNEHLALAEMGSVWVEKYMNGGALSTSFQLEPNGIGTTMDPVNKYRLGLSKNKGDIDKMFPGAKASCAEYGYALGPFLYYLTTYGGSYGITDKSVVELYETWCKFEKLLQGYTTLDFLDSWTKSHNWKFFDGGNNIDDYYLKLWKGELLKGLNFCSGRSIFTFNNLMKKTMPQGSVYPYGCEGLYTILTGFKDVSLRDKELVIKQESPDVQTYLLIANSAEASKVTKITQFPQVAMVISSEYADSIVVSGAELEKYRNSSGEMDAGFFLLTTRQSCYTSFTGSVPSTVVVDLRKAKGSTPTATPTTLYFSADGGKQNVKIDAAGYSYFGGNVREEGRGWCGVRAYVDNGCYVEIGAQPNTSTQQRECIVDCYVSDVPNSTDDQKVKMPVHVVQEGKAEDVPGGDSNIIVTSMHESAYAMMVTLNVRNQAEGSSSIIDLDKVMVLHPGDISFSQNGSTLHLEGKETSTGGSSQRTQTFSCDVAGITHNCSSARVINAKYVKITSDNNSSSSETITFGEIPLTSNGFHEETSGKWASLHFKLYESEGLKVTSYASSVTSKNIIGGGTTTRTYKYVSDPNNMIDIDIYFDYIETGESYAPNHARLSTLPWQTSAETSTTP